ncbi:MAG: YqgE/AlgH family protein [Polyangiaceae bacterium]|nr:YqgE/AlgH family protein [Polyangiaceae bacterium]
MALAPGFLIASPPMGDPNFERTVVLLAMHGPRGALGFVINRVAPLKLGEVMSMAGYGPRVGELAGTVYVGGPVEPGSGWILYSTASFKENVEGAIDVTADVRISSSREVFDALARDMEPPPDAATAALDIGKRMVFLGYSGWGPGQVENEIAHGAWLPAPFDPAVLFDVEIERRWEAAYALMGVSPAMSIGMRTVGEA